MVAGLKVRTVCHSVNVLCGITILLLSLRQKLALILHNFAEMRVDIIIILNIIFVIGRGDKQGIEVNGIYSKLLKVVHLVQDALQVTA